MSQFLAPVLREGDEEVEQSLRPRRLDDFVGQERTKEQLDIALQAAKARGEALDHVLLVGPPGLGKTTLATIIREELGVGIRTVAGPALERKGDMAAILTGLDDEGRPLRRRDPPREPRDRGDPLPGARGLPARHHRRPGSGRADADARPAAVHARRRDDPHRPADDAAARPLRDDLPARLLRAGTSSRRSSAARRGSSASRSRTRPPTRSPAERAGRRVSRTGSCAASATSPRCAMPAPSRSRSRARRSSCSRSTRPGSSASTASSSPRSRTSSAAGRSGCRRWRCRSARSPTRSRTSTSRTSCSSASSSGRRAAASSPSSGGSTSAPNARRDGLF